MEQLELLLKKKNRSRYQPAAKQVKYVLSSMKHFHCLYKSWYLIDEKKTYKDSKYNVSNIKITRKNAEEPAGTNGSLYFGVWLC